LERWKQPAASAVAPPNSAAAAPPVANVQPQQIFLHSRSSSIHEIGNSIQNNLNLKTGNF